MNAINAAAELCFCKISAITVSQQEEGAVICFHAEFGSGGRKRRQQRFTALLAADPALSSIQPAGQSVGVK